MMPSWGDGAEMCGIDVLQISEEEEKSVMMIAQLFAGKERNFMGENFWARGCSVSTIGLDRAISSVLSTNTPWSGW